MRVLRTIWRRRGRWSGPPSSSPAIGWMPKAAWRWSVMDSGLLGRGPERMRCGGCVTGGLAVGPAAVDLGIDGRHEEQRRDGREQQAADHGPAQRGVLLGAFAQAQRHRDHADD